MQYITDGFNQMVEDLKTHIDRVYIEQIHRKEAELNALKMQIQPHYLYNTLDIIRMTALEHDDTETAGLLESLAVQLRYVIGESGERVEIVRELAVLQEYFKIVRVRYQNRFSLHVHISPEDETLLIPKLILQPMVENSIRHGLRPKEGEGLVDLSVRRHPAYLEIRVMDNGVGIAQEKLDDFVGKLEHPELRDEHAGDFHVGIQNVYDRIRFGCGEEYGFTMTSMPGAGTVVVFRLPILEKEDGDAAVITEQEADSDK
jgi:two-component system sensor histidine kinase YesM